MSDLISKEALVNEIVNTPTNSYDCDPVHLNGMATRQLEILDIIGGLPTLSEQEIRDEVIERIIERIEKARQKYQRLCREQGENEDEVMNIHFRGIVKIIKEEASKNVEEIAEQMKEENNG